MVSLLLKMLDSLFLWHKYAVHRVSIFGGETNSGGAECCRQSAPMQWAHAWSTGFLSWCRGWGEWRELRKIQIYNQVYTDNVSVSNYCNHLEGGNPKVISVWWMTHYSLLSFYLPSCPEHHDRTGCCLFSLEAMPFREGPSRCWCARI